MNRYLKMKYIRKTGIVFLIGIGVLLGIILVCNRIIVDSAEGQTYNDTAQIPVNRVGVLLGTSPKLRNGQPNLYFRYRIEAAAALYRSHKISHILVSGDNRKNNYNEPVEMRKALIREGIPDSVIVLDYAGIRTLDSVVRAKKVFGQDSITIISQQFHNERALYIARKNDISAVGFNARDVDTYSGLKTNVRELLARVKLFLDEFTGKGPRHLGEPVPIG